MSVSADCDWRPHMDEVGLIREDLLGLSQSRGYLIADALDLPLGDDLQLLEHDEVLVDVVHQIEKKIIFGRLTILVINRKHNRERDGNG